jgi:hypothetical protein
MGLKVVLVGKELMWGLGLQVCCLMLRFVLACQYSFPILKHKILVYHGLKILEVTCFQSIGKSIIQIIEETLSLFKAGHDRM